MATTEYWFISKLPRIPAVYALYSGASTTLNGQSFSTAGAYPVYIGQTNDLRTRVSQHLRARDSSINTAMAAAKLNPEMVTEVRWWTCDEFNTQGSGQDYLNAAERIAFEVFDPVLRSRTSPAEKELPADDKFRDRMRAAFAGEPNGRLCRPDHECLLKLILDLQHRVELLESQTGGHTNAAGATGG